MRNWLILTHLCVCLTVPGDVFSGAANIESLVPRETSDDSVLKGAPQAFTKETLFEHINGQADLFLQYGFQRSIFAVYENRNSGREKIDLDIYDMGHVVNAFGVFSRFRQEDRPAGIGLDSYLEDRYALFYKGNYFVVLQATEPIPSILKQLARTIESRITDSSPPPKEIGWFPKGGLKSGSIEYYPQGLMGRQFLKRGFKAAYLMPSATGVDADGPDSNLFMAIFENSEEAATALKTFREDLFKRGGSQKAIQTQQGFDMLRGEDTYQGKLTILSKGRYLVGATGFEKSKDAESLLEQLIEQIQ